MRASHERGPDGLLQPRMPAAVGEAIVADGLVVRPEYAKLQMPALAVYSVYDIYPGLPSDADEALRNRAQAFLDGSPKAWQRHEIERFQRECPHGQTLELLGANHTCFIDQRDVVVQAIKQFLQ